MIYVCLTVIVIWVTCKLVDKHQANTKRFRRNTNRQRSHATKTLTSPVGGTENSKKPNYDARHPSTSAPFCTNAFYGRVIWIVDGDTIHVRRKNEVLKIRLNGLDAPEMDQFGGWKAKNFLFRLVRGQTLLCQPIELDNYGRTVAICHLNGRDIAAEAVKAGVALDCRIYSDGRYAALEPAGAARLLGRRSYSRRWP